VKALVPGVLAVLLASAPLAQEPRSQEPQPFEAFVAELRTEALAKGISQTTVERTLVGLEPLAVVVTRDRAQPETTQSLDDYVSQRVTTRRLRTARAKLEEHDSLLRRIEKSYGLPAQTMVAIWGVESNFGSFTGTYPTIAALVTLAWDARRPIFRAEVFEALRIVDEGKAGATELTGSWAGAMGQPQFMPSSYLLHAVDFDADGHANIWTSLPDVFASMANYLKNSGWAPGERWGREVRISKAAMTRVDRDVPMRTGGCRANREMTASRPLAQWKTLGVTLANGAALPSADMDASLVRGHKRHFLVYRNYHALLAYNCSHAYAVTVGLLSDRIPGATR
jgi:membrane-bound lytic murein transglycosylase B